MIEVNLYVDGETIARIMREHPQDVRGLLREQREKDRERAMKLDMIYDQIEREEKEY